MSYQSERLARKNGIAPPLPTKKEKKPIPKVSEKKKKQDAEERKERGGDDTELVKYFKRCIKMFTGYCMETGLRTETRIYEYAVMSVAHILPKSKCPSVALHPTNWIELNVDFHTKFDAMSWEERERLGCWEEIRDRLIMVYPDLAPDERRHYPISVLKYMEKREPFL